MPEAQILVVFVAAALALLLTPGPAVLYVVARSIEQGRRAGLVSCLGLTTGGIIHVVAATLGLSAILVSSATLFSVVKLLGAAYLVYLGIRTLLGTQGPRQARTVNPRRMSRVYWDGVIVNVLNPKAALFFFAFLPQFVDPTKGHAARQVLVLGIIFLLLGLASDSMYAMLAGTLGDKLNTSQRAASVQRWVTGSVYLGLGLATALAGRPER